MTSPESDAALRNEGQEILIGSAVVKDEFRIRSVDGG